MNAETLVQMLAHLHSEGPAPPDPGVIQGVLQEVTRLTIDEPIPLIVAASQIIMSDAIPVFFQQHSIIIINKILTPRPLFTREDLRKVWAAQDPEFRSMTKTAIFRCLMFNNAVMRSSAAQTIVSLIRIDLEVDRLQIYERIMELLTGEFPLEAKLGALETFELILSSGDETYVIPPDCSELVPNLLQITCTVMDSPIPGECKENAAKLFRVIVDLYPPCITEKPQMDSVMTMSLAQIRDENLRYVRCTYENMISLIAKYYPVIIDYMAALFEMAVEQLRDGDPERQKMALLFLKRVSTAEIEYCNKYPESPRHDISSRLVSALGPIMLMFMGTIEEDTDEPLPRPELAKDCLTQWAVGAYKAVCDLCAEFCKANFHSDDWKMRFTSVYCNNALIRDYSPDGYAEGYLAELVPRLVELMVAPFQAAPVQYNEDVTAAAYLLARIMKHHPGIFTRSVDFNAVMGAVMMLLSLDKLPMQMCMVIRNVGVILKCTRTPIDPLFNQIMEPLFALMNDPNTIRGSRGLLKELSITQHDLLSYVSRDGVTNLIPMYEKTVQQINFFLTDGFIGQIASLVPESEIMPIVQEVITSFLYVSCGIVEKIGTVLDEKKRITEGPSPAYEAVGALTTNLVGLIIEILRRKQNLFIIEREALEVLQAVVLSAPVVVRDGLGDIVPILLDELGSPSQDVVQQTMLVVGHMFAQFRQTMIPGAAPFMEKIFEFLGSPNLLLQYVPPMLSVLGDILAILSSDVVSGCLDNIVGVYSALMRNTENDPTIKLGVLEGLMAIGTGLLRSVGPEPAAREFLKRQRAKIFHPILQIGNKSKPFMDIMTDDTRKLCIRFLEEILVDDRIGPMAKTGGHLRKLFTVELHKPEIKAILKNVKQNMTPGDNLMRNRHRRLKTALRNLDRTKK